MTSSAQAEAADIRVCDVRVSEDELLVALMDGRTITVPLAWYPRLAGGTPEQRVHWELAGGGYGIHWPELDKDLSTGKAAGRSAGATWIGIVALAPVEGQDQLTRRVSPQEAL